MDWDARTLAPIYRAMGVPATLTLSGTGYSITCLDLTSGTLVGASPRVQTIDPQTALRATELAANGLSAADLEEGEITFNQKTWKITSVQPKQGPGGELNGEYLLMLEAM
jgi:hypothetical protein